MPIGNKLETVYIPRKYWIDKVKEIGLSFTDNDYPQITEDELKYLLKDGFPQKNKIT